MEQNTFKVSNRTLRIFSKVQPKRPGSALIRITLEHTHILCSVAKEQACINAFARTLHNVGSSGEEGTKESQHEIRMLSVQHCIFCGMFTSPMLRTFYGALFGFNESISGIACQCVMHTEHQHFLKRHQRKIIT